MGGVNPVEGKADKFPDSAIVSQYISEGWEELYGGKLEFLNDADEIIQNTLNHIDEKRSALGLPDYDSTRFGAIGDTRIEEIEALPLEERQAALYGAAR
jgi:hypothetical protein